MLGAYSFEMNRMHEANRPLMSTLRLPARSDCPNHRRIFLFHGL